MKTNLQIGKLKVPDTKNAAIDALDHWLFEQFVCPVDHGSLDRAGNWLTCTDDPRHRFPLVDGMPVFLRDDIEHTAWWSEQSLKTAQRIADGEEQIQDLEWNGVGVHPHVQAIVDSTGGHLYRACKGKLEEYPIPSVRVAAGGKNQLLLDAGCNWGRWTLSAARLGIQSIGVDPSLGAVLAARQIRRQLQLPCAFFVGDCRWLPFRSGLFSNVFSYSVLQHFSKPDARVAIEEFRRVLAERGLCMVQMPNAFGVRSFYHLARRRFHAGRQFEVRYYRPSELHDMFQGIFSNAELSVDGFFGLGIQADDMRFMPWRNRIVIRASELLRGLSEKVPFIIKLADSLYIKSVRVGNA